MKTHRHTERRWSVRHVLWNDLALYTEGIPLSGRVVNLSIGGLFAELDAAALVPNAPVHVLIELDVGAGSVCRRLPAQVIWTGARGAGLMFSDFSHNTLSAIRAILDRLPGHRQQGAQRAGGRDPVRGGPGGH